MIADQLLDWYDRNKRELPWRQNKDAYRIWVSEIMLQQTRVDTVRPYFERWLARFPGVAELAAAGEEEVLREWQGLGYYSRARNLWRGAKAVMEHHGGVVPRDRKSVEALPGVGEYTAGAILSIAYGLKECAVDGNVLRVFSRIFCLEDAFSSAALKKRVRELVLGCLPEARPGDFNEALMDLGATVCLPKGPRCPECPLAKLCCARQKGLEDRFPVAGAKTTIRAIDLAAAVVVRDGAALLTKRPEKGLLAGMWEFPTIELSNGEDGKAAIAQSLCEVPEGRIRVEEELLRMTHVFSHRKWRISFFRCHFVGEEETLSAGLTWTPLAEFDDVVFAGPHRKAAELVLGEQGRKLN